MTPAEIDLARRIIACGLPVPRHRSFPDGNAIVVKLGNEVVVTYHNAGSTDYDPATRILWQVVATDTGPELLPVLDDYALLGWLYFQLKEHGHPIKIGYTVSPFAHTAQPFAGPTSIGNTLVEALVAALEAARKEA